LLGTRLPCARPAAHSPVYADRQDWTIFDDGAPVGRIYENAGASTPADLRWFWSITVYVHPRAGIVTNGKVPTLDEAKSSSRRLAGVARLGETR
jgi:hypothetical protein